MGLDRRAAARQRGVQILPPYKLLGINTCGPKK
jgi:hypothetical protein